MSLALGTALITALSSSSAQSPRGLCVSPLNEAIRVGGFQIFDLHTGGAR